MIGNVDDLLPWKWKFTDMENGNYTGLKPFQGKLKKSGALNGYSLIFSVTNLQDMSHCHEFIGSHKTVRQVRTHTIKCRN